MMEGAEKKVLSISELTRRIKAILECEVGDVWIEGEVSNLRRPASGHLYFTMKDRDAQISAVLFKGNQRAGLVLKDGMLIRAAGRISVYEKGGNYQIIVRTLEDAGKGDLHRRFEELKERLRKEGLFDPSAKKPIPLLPQRVGVVTSPTGAAIRDILNVISRRFPNMHILVSPARVQGDGAAEEIADAIDMLNEYSRRNHIDVIIAGRGGGSVEDLWPFNEESVARAIWRSGIPVISAVGHEIDFTIADFVADLRAPTPSAAAELVVGRKDEFIKQLAVRSAEMTRLLRHGVLEAEARFNSLRQSYVFREPMNMVQRHLDRLDSMAQRMKHELLNSAVQVQQVIDDWAHRLSSSVEIRCQKAAGTLDRHEGSLRAMDPRRVLGRGYSITKDADGRCITSAESVRKGSRLVTLLSDGEIISTVN